MDELAEKRAQTEERLVAMAGVSEKPLPRKRHIEIKKEADTWEEAVEEKTVAA